jgi:DNA polymerase-1
MSFYILDIETNAVSNPDKLWCIVTKNLETSEVDTYKFPSGVPAEYPEVVVAFLSSKVSAWIGHNIINYDLPVLSKLIPAFRYEPSYVIDTLVTSRLLNYNIEDGNSLEAWGNRLKFPKSDFSEFSVFSEEMVDYCVNDVLVTEKLYALLRPYIDSDQWKRSLRLEHDIAFVCNDLHNNGFQFSFDRAKDLHSTILDKCRKLGDTLVSTFPRRVIYLREIHPRRTKSGALSRTDFRWLEDSSDLRQFSGGPFSLVTFSPFNPGSPKQCVEQLWRYGWRPTDKTKGHLAAERSLADARRYDNRRGPRDSSRIGELEQRLEHFQTYGWKVNETNLATLPRDAPEEAHKLVEWLMLNSRRSTLEEWFEAYNPDTGRIHGNFNHIGAWTGRMSHNSPNMANIPGHGSVYGDEMRSLWTAKPGSYLVGVDADSIQLRILAHYMEDESFTTALTKGRKEDGTDAHTRNKLALGDVCRDRDTAKTFIYAFLLGAGIGKVADILGCDQSEAREAVENFIGAYPGLRALKDYRIPTDADRGYFIGLDGRLVACNSEHLMLAGYLQNGEAVIMKTANLIWRENLRKEGIAFWQVNFVHDEWQNELNSLTDATLAGKIMVSAIEEAGLRLKLKCPLTGNAKVGINWLETH